MIVLDASAMVELLLNTPAGRQVGARIAPAELSLHAPHLLDVEVTHVLRRYERTKVITAKRGRLALQALTELDLSRYAHDLLLPRIWALRGNLTAYDASYVALAELLRAPLLTLDGNLANAPGHSARIEWIDRDLTGENP